MAYLDTHQCTSPIQAEEEASPTPVAQPTEESTESEPCVLSIVDISQYSSIYRVLAVTACILRFIHNLHEVQHRLSGPLSSTEVANARKHLIKGVQGLTYRDKFTYMLKKRSKCPSLTRQLHLFLDSDQLIHCGGRIHNAPTTELAKFPVLLPANSPFTDLIVMDTCTHQTSSWRCEYHSDRTEASILDIINTAIRQEVIETMCNLQEVDGKTLQSSRSPTTSKGTRYRIPPIHHHWGRFHWCPVY